MIGQHRILIFIENDIYVRNFVSSNAFELLLKQPDCGICVSEIVHDLRALIPPAKLVGEYERNSCNIFTTFKLNKLSSYALRHRSSTFDIKIRAGFPWGSYNLKWRIGASPLFYQFARNRFLNSFQPNPSLEKIIKQYRPELVIFPVTGVESTGTELIQLSEKYRFDTFFLVNGWDNLSIDPAT
jgi:hypothetical protein